MLEAIVFDRAWKYVIPACPDSPGEDDAAHPS
jgi:hypothetical protein